MSQPAILTLDEVASYLRLPQETVERQAQNGLIPGRQIENTWRFLRDAIDEWLRGPHHRMAPQSTYMDVDKLPDEIENELAELHFLSDDELWQAAETKLPNGASERMQTLILKQQSSFLTKEERTEAEALVYRSHRVMLVRAQAAVILKERGYDISHLGPK